MFSPLPRGPFVGLSMRVTPAIYKSWDDPLVPRVEGLAEVELTEEEVKVLNEGLMEQAIFLGDQDETRTVNGHLEGVPKTRSLRESK